VSPVVSSWQFERCPGMVVSSNSGFASLVRISSDSGDSSLGIAVTGVSDFWLVVYCRCSQMKGGNLVGRSPASLKSIAKALHFFA
jgi:hypothetical protein